MKRIINTLFAAALLAVSVISCQKAQEVRKTDSSSEISKNETISVSLTATMDELTPADKPKSEVTPVIRLTWAPEGDEVFVYDASKCLGTLEVSLKDDDVRYAYLNGTIECPSEGTKVLTCIHAKGLSEAPSVESGKVTVSLADQNGQDSEIPFVVFGTIDYNGQSSIADQLVNFSFATSVVNVNCIGLAMDGQTQEQIKKASVNGLNTACQLTLSSTAAPGVSGVALGDITRTGIAGGSNKLAFLVSVPESQSASGRKLYVFQQTKTLSSNFTSSALNAGKFINVMYYVDVHAESVSLDIENKEIEPGEEFTLTATVTPEDALIKDVTWSSSNENVATVDENGKVKGVVEGSATITVTTVDEGRTATCSVRVTPYAGILPGKFTVNAQGKKVHFSRGNLWYGDHRYVDRTIPKGFYLEAEQWGGKPLRDSLWNTSHICHFYWGDNEIYSCHEQYAYGGPKITDVLFTNRTETTPNPEFKVFEADKEQKGVWRSLADSEWQYILYDRKMTYNKPRFTCIIQKIRVESGLYSGTFIYPDDYNSEEVGGSKEFTWQEIKDAGIVFLPTVGYREKFNVYGLNNNNLAVGYWSSTTVESDVNAARCVIFNGDGKLNITDEKRSTAHCIRLVCDCND